MKSLPTLRQLHYLAALAEHRHFGHAAEACFVTQSTLSAGLQELESVLGAILVERSRRRVMLTALGAEVARRGAQLLKAAEDITALTRAAAEPLTGPLRLGVIPTIAPYLLPRLLPALRQAFPHLKLTLREDLTARLLGELESGHLDAVVVALPYDTGTLETEEFAIDPFLLACAADHPLAALTQIAPDDLAQAELLLLEEGHCLREHALAACRLPGARASETVRGTSLQTVVQMVAAGLGVTLLPTLAVRSGAAFGLVLRPLAGPAPARRLAVAWRRSSSQGEDYRRLASFIGALPDSFTQRAGEKQSLPPGKGSVSP